MAYRLLEKTIYAVDEPRPRVRDPTRPMAVLCPGMPRSGTESLQTALIKLGYSHTYHGWDILLDEENYMPAWVRLCRKKFEGDASSDCVIEREEFDAVVGHCEAMTDAVTPLFAADLIHAYPEAKVVLSVPRDMDRWHRSAVKNLVGVYENWSVWRRAWLTPYGYWSWTVYERYIWPYLFRAGNGKMNDAIRKNGKWVYREHIAMIRGLVPKENLLEWSVDDGWEPLCNFLGKDVPDEPFPHVNDASGFAGRVETWKATQAPAERRAVIFFSTTLAALTAVGIMRYTGLKGLSQLITPLRSII